MNRALQHLILGADLLWIIACFGMLRTSGVNPVVHPALPMFTSDPIVLVAIAVWSLIYFRKELSGFNRGWDLSTICSQIFVGILYLLISLSIAAFALREEQFKHQLPVLAFLVPIGLIFTRCTAYWLVESRLHGRAKQKVMIVGSGRIVRELTMKIDRHPELCMEVVGILSPSDAERADERSSARSDIASLRTLNIMDLLQRENEIGRAHV